MKSKTKTPTNKANNLMMIAMLAIMRVVIMILKIIHTLKLYI
jgi:hypothetical protein